MGLFDFLKRDEDPTPKADLLSLDDEADDAAAEEDLEDEEFFEKEAPADRAEKGPFDESEVEAPGEARFIELGGLRIPAREGLGLRLEIEEQSQRLVAVALDYRESTLQVQAFAAPRSEGLWGSIRSQLADQIRRQGGTAKEQEGRLGTVVEAALPVTAGGPATRRARFVGVDGPRWFLRGVLTGKALVDDDALDGIEELFRSIVVVRGATPLPPRELLTLQIPPAMAEQMKAAQQAQAARQSAEAAAQAIADRAPAGATASPAADAAAEPAPQAPAGVTVERGGRRPAQPPAGGAQGLGAGSAFARKPAQGRASGRRAKRDD